MLAFKVKEDKGEGARATGRGPEFPRPSIPSEELERRGRTENHEVIRGTVCQAEEQQVQRSRGWGLSMETLSPWDLRESRSQDCVVPTEVPLLDSTYSRCSINAFIFDGINESLPISPLAHLS